MKKVLFIITSHADMLNTDTKTGVWLGEFTDPYYEFKDVGFNVVLASPKGGQPPVDTMSQLTEHITGSNRRFQDDLEAQQAFANTLKLDEVKEADYDALFLPGGHGPLWDLAESETTGKIINDFVLKGKVVGAVCHGPAAFLAAEKQNPGFLKGRKISCFSNAEEALTGRKSNVPYLLEDTIRNLGAEIDNNLIPFTAHTTTSDNIATGQNPLSAGPVARLTIELIKSRQ